MIAAAAPIDAPGSPPLSPSCSAAAAVLVELPSGGGGCAGEARPDDSSEATEDGRPTGGALVPLGEGSVSDTAATPSNGGPSDAVAGTAEMEVDTNVNGVPIVAAARGRKPMSSTSKYHGVTKHRWSGKYEAHLWDSNTRVEGRRRKGKQVYLGSYDSEEKAARTHDLAALKYWGSSSRLKLNFPISEYEKELENMRHMTQEECVASLRRRSCCFSRGASVYRGVTRRQKDGRWQARIGRVAGTRDIYLGTFKTEEEAAEAYDIAAIELRGPSAITNFDISNYCTRGFGELEEDDLEQLDSSTPCKLEL